MLSPAKEGKNKQNSFAENLSALCFSAGNRKKIRKAAATFHTLIYN